VKASWDGVPGYVLIARALREQIVSGHLNPGDKVPTAETLSSTWEVSLATANRALRQLRTEGLAELRPGLGTFVLARATTSVMLLPGDTAVVTRANGSIEHVSVVAGTAAGADNGD
jgi:GntR family transcriptional regulator, transcriptional repressor for pyruvate dehydrogenase complex